MTAAQKTAKAKFKQAIAYRQKTGVSLKEAFAHIYGKKVGAVKKKAAPKKKAAKKVVRKVVKKKAAPKKKVAKKKLTRKDYDKRFQADKPGKRTSASGNTYYEYRGNRSDKGKLLGIGNITIDKYKKVQNDVIALEKALNRNLEQMKQIQYKTPFWKQRFKISNAKLKSYIKELKTHGKELKKII